MIGSDHHQLRTVGGVIKALNIVVSPDEVIMKPVLLEMPTVDDAAPRKSEALGPPIGALGQEKEVEALIPICECARDPRLTHVTNHATSLLRLTTSLNSIESQMRLDQS